VVESQQMPLATRTVKANRLCVCRMASSFGSVSLNTDPGFLEEPQPHACALINSEATVPPSSAGVPEDSGEFLVDPQALNSSSVSNYPSVTGSNNPSSFSFPTLQFLIRAVSFAFGPRSRASRAPSPSYPDHEYAKIKTPLSKERGRALVSASTI